ncbi:GNAT family N-acetyltransferase [Kutzneria buriramensis]|uniref:GNAT family N-acetyltransferase n=1 Tax=Kutzneria buriramensis TaxID=1045776 RepID=UPI00147718E4|nr:GNAT family N-acetyltransferase [Kutzneria buriramensis]
MGVEVESFDPEHATDDDLRGYYQVMLARQETDRPDIPRLTYEDVLGRLKNPFVGFGPVAYWVARLNGELVGLAIVYFMEEESSHIGLTEVIVHPRVRRRSIGATMLQAILPELRARGRTFVETWQITEGSDGERFANALGFHTAHTVLSQALVISETDSALWQQSVPPGYRVQQWTDAAPDDLVASFAKAFTAMQDAPTGDLGFGEPVWNARRVRAHEAELRQNNVELRVVVAVHEDTGDIAGLTQLELHPHRPYWAFQRDTAVLPAHRGHGLGRCIKAYMIRWLLADRPDLDRINTTTGAANAHMIRVNHQLGYRTARTMIAVNRDLAELEADLGARCSASTQ